MFGFEVLIKRINLSFYGKGMLTIDDWITQAKNGAVAAAIKNKVNLNDIQAQQCGRHLYEKYKNEPEQIHTLANTNLGDLYLTILEDIKTKPQVNPELQLCYVIASKFPKIAKAALNHEYPLQKRAPGMQFFVHLIGILKLYGQASA
ncbi:MAG TPA: hypothetical protein VHC96_08205 [Puia sp.]|nr:hypothetical protein [Puia sp.]